MAGVDPIPKSDAETQGIDLDSFARLGDEEAVFLRILARVPGYAEAIWGAMSESLFEGNVDHRLKEIVRLQLASTAEDAYFGDLRSKEALASGLTEERIAAGRTGFDTDPDFTDAEKWALRYAWLMYRRPEQVDADFYAEGKRHFSEAEIMELGGLIAIHYGMQVFMRTMGNPA